MASIINSSRKLKRKNFQDLFPIDGRRFSLEIIKNVLIWKLLRTSYRSVTVDSVLVRYCNDVMAAILKVWHHVKNVTPSIDVYLLEEKSCPIFILNPDPIWNDQSISLF